MPSRLTKHRFADQRVPKYNLGTLYEVKIALMGTPYKIPADIYERVHDVMLDIVNATLAEDAVLTSVYYEQLREFCEEQTAAGRGSGFLWEALADVTDDRAQSRRYYQRALLLARQNLEPTDTILQELGPRRHCSDDSED